jgi:hypothetical protein
MWGNVRIQWPLGPKQKFHFRIFAKNFFTKIGANSGIIIDVEYLGNGASDWILKNFHEIFRYFRQFSLRNFRKNETKFSRKCENEHFRFNPSWLVLYLVGWWSWSPHGMAVWLGSTFLDPSFLSFHLYFTTIFSKKKSVNTVLARQSACRR